MNYKINGLTINAAGEDELLEIANHTFATKEEALTFIKENISFQAYNEFKDTLALVVDGVSYHYSELEPVSEEL
jgi:hypothetical protein